MGDSSEATRHFAGIVLTIILSSFFGRTGRGAPLWLIACRLPATVLHEAAHYLVALVTGGRPAGFTILPVSRKFRRGDGAVVREWVLGSVTLRSPGVVSALPTGMAPLSLAGAAWLAWRQWFDLFPRDFPHTLGLYVVVCLLCCGSVPSPQDFRIAFSRLAGVALYAVLAGAAFFYLQM